MEPLHPSLSLPDVYHNQKYTSFWEFEGGLLVNGGGPDVSSKKSGKQQHIDIVADEHGHADGSVADIAAVHDYHLHAVEKRVGREPPPDSEED